MQVYYELFRNIGSNGPLHDPLKHLVILLVYLIYTL